MKTIAKFTLIITIFFSLGGFTGCERMTQVLDSHTAIPVEERDHVWPIDQMVLRCQFMERGC